MSNNYQYYNLFRNYLIYPYTLCYYPDSNIYNYCSMRQVRASYSYYKNKFNSTNRSIQHTKSVHKATSELRHFARELYSACLCHTAYLSISSGVLWRSLRNSTQPKPNSKLSASLFAAAESFHLPGTS